MATFLGLACYLAGIACYLAGIALVFLLIFSAIHKVASLLLPSLDVRQSTFTATIVLTAVAWTTPWATCFSIAGYQLLKTVWSMLLLCPLLVAIHTVVEAYVPSAMMMVQPYNVLSTMFSYTATILLSRELRMPSTFILEIVCVVLFFLLLFASFIAVAEALVPSVMERHNETGYTLLVLAGLSFLVTTMMWTMPWSTPPVKKPALTILGLPSASTAPTLGFDDFPKAHKMNIILTAIQEMKVEHKRDMGKMLAAMAWMIRIPIFVVVILIAATAWIIKFLRENSDELINACVSKATAFAKDILGPWRSAFYKPPFQIFVGSTRSICEALRKLFS